MTAPHSPTWTEVFDTPTQAFELAIVSDVVSSIVAGGSPHRHKAIAITGTTSGIGHECACIAATLGVKLVLCLDRPSPRVEPALAAIRSHIGRKADGTLASRADGRTASDLTSVVHIDCDLADLDSVRGAAKRVRQACGDELDVLACNAGIGCFGSSRSADGFDIQMAVNHMGHFLLIQGCQQALDKAAADPRKGEARVVLTCNAYALINGACGRLGRTWASHPDPIDVAAALGAPSPRGLPEEHKLHFYL